MMNIAILSPSQNAYSETFIKAHKDKLKGNVFYYFGNLQNKFLEGTGSIHKTNKNFYFKIKRKWLHKNFSWYYNQLLVESFKKNKIDLVLAEYGPTAQQHLEAAKQLKLPLIVHFHGYDASVKYVIKQNDYYKEVFKYASFIIVVSKKMSIDLLKLGCPKAKLVLNTCGPNPDFLKIKPNFNKPQFIALGRFVDKKAPYYLILSFVKVVKDYPQAILIIAGKGVLWNTCKNLISAFGLEKNVMLPGIITQKQVELYFSESIGYVQHSVTADNGDAEGTPVAIFEASAAGLPVVSTIHAGIPDVIEDGRTGLLVQEHDVMGMTKNMIRLIEEPDLAQELGSKGKENIKNNFTLQRHIDVLDSLIEKCTT